MKPGARCQAAIELLDQMQRQDTDVASLVDGYFRKRRFAGSGDRRWIIERVYEVARARARLGWWIERTGLGQEPGPRMLLMAHLVLRERTTPDDLAQLFSGDRHSPPAITPQEQDVSEALYGRPFLHGDMPRWVRLEYPEWMDMRLEDLWGAETEAELAALNQTAPVDLRVNVAQVPREDAQSQLSSEFVETEPTPLSPLGLRLVERSRIGGTHAFKTGMIEVQDEGSQIVSFLVDAKPGMTVVDYCAGAGGKTLALAAAMTEGGRMRGRLVACDLSQYRLDRARPRIDRAGINGIQLRAVAAREDPWVAANEAIADRVLVDAPCTGTGTWRRDPEAKWRFETSDLDGLRKTQREIMAQAARLVAPGGRLIYVTCSFLREENEDQASWFTSAHPAFKLQPIGDVWAESIGGTAPELGETLRLSPASAGTDGFFCAVFERAGASAE